MVASITSGDRTAREEPVQIEHFKTGALINVCKKHTYNILTYTNKRSSHACHYYNKSHSVSNIVINSYPSFNIIMGKDAPIRVGNGKLCTKEEFNKAEKEYLYIVAKYFEDKCNGK